MHIAPVGTCNTPRTTVCALAYAWVWALPRSLAATWGISVDFFSSGYLDISVLQVRFPTLCIQIGIPLARWVSPFGHPRIKVCCRLPEAFRRLPRPSSPLTAKASTVCAYSLDHITSKRLRVSKRSHAQISLTCLNDTFKALLPHRSFHHRVGQAPNAYCYVPSCQRTQPATMPVDEKPWVASARHFTSHHSTQTFSLFVACRPKIA